MIYMIPQQDLPSVLGRFILELERAIPFSRGEESLGTIIDKLMSGRAHLWCADGELWGVTEFKQMIDHKELLVSVACGRDVEQHAGGFIEAFQTFAKNNGCSCVVAYCRPGWSRLAKVYGFKPDRIIFRLEV